MDTNNKTEKQLTPIAIIGAGCLFPKAEGLKEYWRLLFQGIDGITEVPGSHWSPDDYFNQDPKTPDHTCCKRGGFLSPLSFDPSEFGIPPASLESTDTSQLLGLVAAKMALEDSGYGDNGRDFNRDKTSVILGVTGTQELVIPLGARLGFPKWRKALEESGVSPDKTNEIIDKISSSYVSWQENSFPGLLGNVVAGRICNRLDLGGTNCVVDAACASSMSATHLSIMELSSGRSDMVITGGVDTLNDVFMHMCFSKTQALSLTGDARPFSKDADGTVLGEGVGLIVLKRLDEAVRDKDRIYAVIKSMGTSSDGKSQSIYAPRAEGQVKALQRAYYFADIEPDTVELIEAHGTGTKVGDITEFKALHQFFGESNKQNSSCALGSVKSNIGHTKSAAGAAGIIKSALALHHKVLPPTLKAQDPDPKLGIDQSPFYLNTDTRPWFSSEDHPRRSGVSAFGFGGSNFHIVLEEYTQTKNEISWDGSVQIFALSAPTKQELIEKMLEHKHFVDKGPSWREVSVLCEKTRNAFSCMDDHRLLLVLEYLKDDPSYLFDKLPALFLKATELLEAHSAANAWAIPNAYYSGSEIKGSIAFIFPGQGSQYVNMGKDLVCTFPEALDSVSLMNSKLHTKQPLKDIIYPASSGSNTNKNQYEDSLKQTDIAQPAIGAISMAMFKTLQQFNIQPDAVCGHSYGELTALFAAGWINEDTFCDLSIARGSIMANTGKDNSSSSGTMLAIRAPLDEIADLVEKSGLDIVLANKNSPDQGVVSGPVEGVYTFEEICKQHGYRTVRLSVSAAFHSSLVSNACEPFLHHLKQAEFTPTNISVYSNTTGEPYPQDRSQIIKYLAEHILHPVDFVREIRNMYASGIKTFIEIGPKSVLTGMVKAILNGQDIHAISMDTSTGKRSGIADLARALCHLASLGHTVDLTHWEHPYPVKREQMMSIPISGANYRSVSKQQPQKTNPQPIEQPAHQHIRVENNTTPMNNTTTKDPEFLSNALKTVQDALKTMQSLQIQTAETHKKFLEAQAENSRILKALVENTRQITAGTLGIQFENPPQPIGVRYAVTPDVTLPDQPVSIDDHAKPSYHATSDIHEPSSHAEAAISTDNGSSSQPPSNHAIEQTMLDVVSQLTGYPIEMLGMDMDIEADLGIDSIKKVEILSTLEENIPDLPQISPEIIGSLKTLGQISQYLSKGSDTSSISQVQTSSAALPSTEPQTDNKSTTGIHTNEVKNILLSVVCQLTGYPEEMLGLDLDIEADLGIDSIKKVEILSTLEENIPGLPQVSPDLIGSLKTLGQILDYLSSTDPVQPLVLSPEKDPVETPVDASNTSRKIRIAETAKTPDHLFRKVVSIVQEPIEDHLHISLAKGKKVFVTDDQSGLSKAIVDELNALGFSAAHISINNKNMTNLAESAAGLIIVQNPDIRLSEADTKDIFLAAKTFAPFLAESGKKDTALFATVSRMDGAFGFKPQPLLNPEHGAFAGLVKSAAIEWDTVQCRAIDVAGDMKADRTLAKNIVSEILNSNPSSPIEIGVGSDSRTLLNLEPSPVPTGDISLGKKDVLIVTGGARGVTASCVHALAKHAQPTLILFGRSPSPVDEPQWLTPLNDPAEIKRAILENEFKDDKVSPIHLETAFKKYMANREIKDNICAFEKAGSTVKYYPIDILNKNSVIHAVNEARALYGSVSGIIHGAGVLQDRLIIDKTPEQFERVFNTKVTGFKNILESVDEDKLKHLIIFSSIAARTGNQGQSDYAMANEVLNKLAAQESAKRPECNVVSINWGPWDGGMVSSALKKEFERNNIKMIPVEQGAMAMLDEMRNETSGHIEVVIGASGIQNFQKNNISNFPKRAQRSSTINETLSLTFKREIDVNNYPVLSSHVLDGTPVVPLALISEWMGHGALHENPGLVLQGLDDMRVLKGIRLDHGKKLIRLLAGKARKNGLFYEVDVELRNGQKGDKDVVHSKAKAILTDNLLDPPEFSLAHHMDTRPFPLNMEEVYDKVLFHGTDLRGIKHIQTYSSQGMVAIVASAPSPAHWMTEPLRNKWIGDPLALDCAFQMATLWCYMEKGVVSLPSYAARYRQYRTNFPENDITAVLYVTDTSEHKMKGNFTFLDTEGSVIARLDGYEAIMDASLFKSFKPQYATA